VLTCGEWEDIDMMTTLLAIAVTATPLLAIAGLLRLVEWVQRRRDARYARQIELTDAIHRELGAAAAPTLQRRLGGGWLIHMMVPLDRPAVVGVILQITDRVFASGHDSEMFQIVLTPAPPSAATVAGASRVARHRPLESAARVIAAAR